MFYSKTGKGVIAMKLKARLCCKNCNSFEEKVISLPFDCDNFICINCGESDCLFVVSVLDEIKPNENYNDKGLLRHLYEIRRLC